MAGMTWSFGSGEGDAWVLRLDGAGKVKWERAIGGPAGDLLTAVLPLEDGGAIVVGRSDSFPADVWIIRIDPAGRGVWERTYGGEGRVWVEAIAPAAAGGFVFGGVTIPGGVPANQERWLVRIDEAGAILWQKAYPSGPSYLDEVYGLAPIPGGGYYLSGASAWSEGWELVDSAATLMRLDPAGDISAGCESVLRTDRVAKVVESRLVETTATVADTAATSTDSAFTPVAIGSRVSEPCAGLLPPQEISGPGAAHPLLFTHNTGLAWEPAAAGGACVFNLYRGVVSELPAGRYGKCLAPGLTVSAATDGETPPSGEAFLYLVTGLNRAGEGSAGSDSAGIPITGLLPCP